jgi:predicted RNA-binding protein YlxR (DUF448 family)
MLSPETTVSPPPCRSKGRGGAARLRRCLVSREAYPVDQLIRFVAGPDRTIVPDIEGRLPGRGLWLRARRETLEAACDGRHFARAARAPVQVEPGLADRVEALLVRRCLDIIGLARRSSEAVSGFEKTMAALKSRKPAVLCIAHDAGEDGRGKMLSVGGNAAVVDLFSSEELGRVFGRDKTVFAAVARGGLADLLMREVSRLKGFRCPGAAGEL